MTDLPLSLLSRGCGRLVAPSGGSGGRDGRLDVCLTPQDYDLWKSKEALLLPSRGRLLAKPTVPKTFSTRRGALLLYSQELVSVETSHRPDVGVRKKKVIQRDTQQMKQRLSSLKELTAAILSYRNNQSSSSRLAPPPNLPPPLHCTRPASPRATAPAGLDLLLQLNPQWLPAKNSTAVKTHEKDTDEQQDSERVRVDVFLQMPRTSRTPTPQQWLHYVATSPDKAEQQQSDTDDILQDPERSLHVMDTETCHGDADDGGAAIQDGRNPDDEDGTSTGKQKQQIHGKPETNTPLGLSLRQRVKRSLFNRLWEETDEPRSEASSCDGHHPQRLPPIAEGRALTPDQRSHVSAQPGAQGDAAQVQPQENMSRLNKQPLVLPLLFPATDDTKQRRGRDKTKKQPFKRDVVETGGGGGGGRLPSDKACVIHLEPEEEPSPPVGVLGCVAGWRGPGRQSSFAFLQNRTPDPHEPGDSALVRGVLPLELRDFQNGRSAGCLILGPDGEIIQLSLDTSRGSLQEDGDLKQRALQVLSTEGEELPWVIVLQPEAVDTEGEVEPSTCGPQSDAPQSMHRDFVQGVFQETERHSALFNQFVTGDLSLSTKQQIENSFKGNDVSVRNSSVFNSNQFSGLPISTETKACSPRGHANTVIMTKNKTQSAEEPLKMWKEAKTRVKVPPLREQGGKEQLRGGSSDEDEEDDEELSTTEKTLQNISPGETAAKDEDRWRKKRVTEEDAVTAGKNETSTELNELEKRTMKKEKHQKPRSGDVQSVRGLRRESVSREEAETQDQSVPSPKKKKKKIKNRGDTKLKELSEDQESVRRKASAGGRRGRRGRPAHKELTVENPPEDEDVGIHQEKQADPRRPSATHTTEDTEDGSDPDTDDLGTSDKRSCIQSLRSSLASSQRNPSSSVRPPPSFYERTVPASSSRGRLSSCSTVMITEDQLMLNPVKPEFPRPTKSREAEEAAAQRVAQRAERRRQEVERKRRQQEEEERKQQQKEQTEERMKNELEGERRKRAEELRLKKLTEEEERRRREEEEQEKARREQAQRERERRRQEDMRRQIERLRRMREQEEQRRKAEQERLRVEEEKKEQEEENHKLQQMDERERTEYLGRKEREKEERQKEEGERRRREQEAACSAAEEARLQAELLAGQMALLQQQRDLMLEAEGLEKTRGISRPWIYSYFTLLQLLGPNSVRAVTKTP
ncbi:uncharacterized protein KIAA2012 homolog [Betta splendens]|uniref:Uncharacterized protein KIAA2012 homolog n=1 Tax=Betta splendens TaxID=158456 RepID=A0A9W2XGJ8_BETSP|nr:uncharacterized protein KIAA2012 homolog [Betta splendens]